MGDLLGAFIACLLDAVFYASACQKISSYIAVGQGADQLFIFGNEKDLRLGRIDLLHRLADRDVLLY